MPNVCILTDSTVQFTQSDFPGHKRIHIIPFELQAGAVPDSRLIPGNLSAPIRLVAPSVEDFDRYYTKLSQTYDSILVLTLSSFFSSIMEHANTALQHCKYCAPVEVIDSQTTSIGLGILAQLAAQAASQGASLKEIDLLLRANIARIYMLYCLPELTYLANSGHLDNAQALVAEMMGILPIFTVEEGRLVPIEKVRTPRHLFEAFQEFMGEFEQPALIALVHSQARGSLRTTQLRQFVQENFPETSFSEHSLSPHVAALLGPRSIGMVLLDSE